MAEIASSVDIARPPDEVFRYATDPAHFGEWQDGVVSGHIEADGQVKAGDKCIMTRRIGGANRTVVSEITEFSPPERWAVHGIDGPIRADVRVIVEPRADGSQSHVTVELDFSGHGIGKVLVPMVVRQSRAEVPRSCQKLKERLEAGG